jgi:hypothetical protein
MRAEYMFTAGDLYEKLKEIKLQIDENINGDGSLRFDPYKVMICLELARKMAVGKEDYTQADETGGYK